MWMITADFVADPTESAGTNANAVGLKSWNYKPNVSMPYHFRMRDDDGITYYFGISNLYATFYPLDEFGAPNAGCTYIEWKDPSGTWRIL